jgi:aconitate hydratase
MAPEYGATMGFFPVDAETLTYLTLTGRDRDLVDLVERYSKEAGLFRTDETPDPAFTETLSLDMSTIEPSVAGPKRPQDRVQLRDVKGDFDAGLSRPTAERGFALSSDELDAAATVARNGDSSLNTGP